MRRRDLLEGALHVPKFGLRVVLGDLDRHLLVNYESTSVPPAFEYRDGRGPR